MQKFCKLPRTRYSSVSLFCPEYEGNQDYISENQHTTFRTCESNFSQYLCLCIYWLYNVHNVEVTLRNNANDEWSCCGIKVNTSGYRLMWYGAGQECRGFSGGTGWIIIMHSPGKV